ncbi:MAG: DUF6268 family outer membrane beta-barrel protein [Verrucomicrobiota bacterium]
MMAERVTQFLFAISLIVANPLLAQQVPIDSGEPEWLRVSDTDIETRPTTSISHEADVGFSYSGEMGVDQGTRDLGDQDAFNSYVNYTAAFPIHESIQARVGFSWDRYSFGAPSATPLPDTLQQTSLNIGFDIELADKWLMRLEAAPGIYSDFEDISLTDVNVPVILGFSYFVNSELQWFFGVSADFRREIPILPGVGVRWQFAEDWTLMFLLPKPQLQYQIHPAVTAYVGADLKGGNYAVSKDFGTDIGQPNLDNEVVEYLEARLGGGVNYKLHPAVTVGVEAGAVMFRQYDFQDDDLTLQSDEPVPYGAISLKATF